MRIHALLLPARIRVRPSAAFRALRVTLIVLPFAVFAWIAVQWVSAARREAEVERKLEPLREARTQKIREIQALLVPPAEVARVESSVAALNATTSAGSTGVLSLLPALERELPDGTGLTALTLKADKGPIQVTLTGAARGEAELAKAADNLGRLPTIRLRGWKTRPQGGLEWSAEGEVQPAGVPPTGGK